MYYVYNYKYMTSLPETPRPDAIRLVPGLFANGCIAGIRRSDQTILTVNSFNTDERREAFAWLDQYFDGVEFEPPFTSETPRREASRDVQAVFGFAERRWRD